MKILGENTIRRVRARSTIENEKLRDSIVVQARNGGTNINNRSNTIMRNEEKGIIILYYNLILLLWWKIMTLKTYYHGNIAQNTGIVTITLVHCSKLFALINV